MGWKMPSLTWCTNLACLTTLKYGLGQNSTKFILCTCRIPCSNNPEQFFIFAFQKIVNYE